MLQQRYKDRMTSPMVLIMQQANNRRTHSTRNQRFSTSGMLFSACYALNTMLGLLMLTPTVVLADPDWAVTTIPNLDVLCEGIDCFADYEDSPCTINPELCQQDPIESKRGSGFSAWGGKRVPFSTWGGKRTPFSSWGGKRVPFASWGGKRSQQPDKGGNFNAWGGKRVPFSAWGGKRAGAFSSWGGKRGEEQIFSAWGGKRDPSRDKRASSGKRNPELRPILINEKGLAIRRGSVDFFPWGGKRAGAPQ